MRGDGDAVDAHPTEGDEPSAAAPPNPGDAAEGSLAVAEAVGRHASNLELFLDLAFVFAVAQISVLLAGDLTVAGLARGLLVALLVWWLWSQFAWLGTAVDVERQRGARLAVLAVVPVVLLLGVAIPGAFGPSGRQLGLAYLVIQLWALGIQGVTLWSVPENRRAWFSYAPLAALGPALVAVGGFLSGDARTATWAVAAAVSVGGAIAAGRSQDEGSEWRVDPTHFAERHALFVIIVLGEVLVACGVAAGAVELTPAIGAGLVAAVSVACVLWWAYFGFVAGASEGALARATGADRGRVARDVFTFGHFPLVVGVALYALVAKHLVPAPLDVLATADLVVLVLAVAAFVGGMMALHWRVVRGVAPERLVLIVAVAAWCGLVGPHVAGSVVVAGVAVGLLLMHLVTLRMVARRTAGGPVDPV